MNTIKKLGIWIDHAQAHLSAFSSETMNTKIVESDSVDDNGTGMRKSEKTIHHKEQQISTQYFNALMDEIKLFNEVLLFGPTHAKTELFNVIRKDHHFDQIEIYILASDYLTENQEHAFIKDYFNKKDKGQ